MTESRPYDLQERIIDFGKSTDVSEESFLMRRLTLDDPEQVQKVIDGITLSFISYCYHRHPRGENVHEVMELVEAATPGSEQARELERRADDAAALQIPFIVTSNRLLEEYYELRCILDERLRSVQAK